MIMNILCHVIYNLSSSALGTCMSVLVWDVGLWQKLKAWSEISDSLDKRCEAPAQFSPCDPEARWGVNSAGHVCYWFITRGQFWPSGIVIACVCVCVRVCVCQSVCQSLACPRDNLGPVQARIAKFGPKMQKTLVKVPIVLVGNWPWPSRSN